MTGRIERASMRHARMVSSSQPSAVAQFVCNAKMSVAHHVLMRQRPSVRVHRLLLLAVGVWLLAGCASSPRAAVPAKSAPSAVGSRVSSSKSLAPYAQIDVADRIRQVAAKDRSYVDMRLLVGNHFVIDRCSRGGQTTETTYRDAVAGSAQVSFERATLCADQTAALTRLVTNNQAWLAQNGVQVSAFGAGTPGPYVIGYSERSRPNDTLLRRFLGYGPGTVIFKHVGQAGSI
jgi:hypothetical protein